MPQIISVPNYGDVEFPDDMSDADITKAIKKSALGYKQPVQESSYSIGAPSLSNLKENATDFGKGLLSGAADIGNTLINASTYVPRKIESVAGGNAINNWNDERQAGLESFNQDNANNPVFQVGKIGGNIAGTAGVGGAAGLTLKAASKTPQASAWADAIASGGLSGTNLTNRLGGGAIQGALGSLLIDPENTKTGALTGAALPVVGQVGQKVGGLVADIIGNTRTATGGQALKSAAKAGMQGGEAKQALVDNMRGNVPLSDVLASAEQNLTNIGQQASQAYRSGMVDIKNDKSILGFGGIDNALKSAYNKVSFKGKVKNTDAAKAVDNIYQEINDWKLLDPAEYHTPEGLDALKQKIGGIVESIPFEQKTARMAAGGIYDAIKNEISAQAPTYSKVMKQYADGMSEINEIKRTLSVGGKATDDTKLRKLQSVLRNNVNTNYGQRAELLKTLEQKGGNDLSYALAGQSLNDLTPKGLGKYLATPTALASGAVGGIPLAAFSLASSSPRLMGEAALKIGQGAGLLSTGAKSITPIIPALSGILNQQAGY